MFLLHAFTLYPRTYEATADLLAFRGARVIVPAWLETPRAWTAHHVLDCFEATMDHHGVAKAVIAAHSFGGGLALGFAARHPERVSALVFADSTGLTGSWRLASDFVSGSTRLYRLATRDAGLDFFRSWFRRGFDVCRAGWWGFRSEHEDELDAVASAGIPVHVLWAERDTVLSRNYGRDIAERLNGTFRLVSNPMGGRPVDHDWMYRHPELYAETVDSLGVL